MYEFAWMNEWMNAKLNEIGQRIPQKLIIGECFLFCFSFFRSVKFNGVKWRQNNRINPDLIKFLKIQIHCNGIITAKCHCYWRIKRRKTLVSYKLGDLRRDGLMAYRNRNIILRLVPLATHFHLLFAQSFSLIRIPNIGGGWLFFLQILRYAFHLVW